MLRDSGSKVLEGTGLGNESMVRKPCCEWLTCSGPKVSGLARTCCCEILLCPSLVLHHWSLSKDPTGATQPEVGCSSKMYLESKPRLPEVTNKACLSLGLTHHYYSRWSEEHLKWSSGADPWQGQPSGLGRVQSKGSYIMALTSRQLGKLKVL